MPACLPGYMKLKGQQMRMSRRRFLGASVATTLAMTMPGLSQNRRARRAMNLVPTKPCAAPNYWCTWAVQNYMYGQGMRTLDPTLLEGGAGADLARTAMTEKNLFGKSGWA